VRDLDIRRPDLLGVRRTGTVRWFNEDKGYGRTAADDGEVLFVHHVGIVGEGYRKLDEGQRVSFVADGRVVAHDRHVAMGVEVIVDE
jgi:cold shock CspA family protein